MSTIDLEVGAIRTIADNLNSISRDIENASLYVTHARASLNMLVASRENINGRLAEDARLLYVEQEKMQMLQGILLWAADEYENSDHMLGEDADGIAQGFKMIGDIARMIPGVERGIIGIELLYHWLRIDKGLNMYMYFSNCYDELPSWFKKLEKNGLKSAFKALHFEGMGKFIDFQGFVDDIVRGKYGDALEDLMGLADLEGFDYSGVKFSQLIKDPKAIANGMNSKYLYVMAGIKTINMTLDKNGYLQKNNEKYVEDMIQRFRKGDILGGIAGFPADFIQTVGKGSVDVTCKMIHSGLDSIMKTMTGGVLDISTINAFLEDQFGWSPGTVFNDITGVINDGVDFFTDKILIEGFSATQKVIGKGVSVIGDGLNAMGKVADKGIKLIGSGFKFLGSLF